MHVDQVRLAAIAPGVLKGLLELAFRAHFIAPAASQQTGSWAVLPRMDLVELPIARMQIRSVP